MAGWYNFEVNDDVFQNEEAIVCEIAKLLQFNYNRSQTTQHSKHFSSTSTQPSGHSILKNVYRVLPQALGFPSWDGQLSLVCSTSISESIFWDYVVEAFNLKFDELNISDDNEVSIQLRKLAGLSEVPPHLSLLRIVYLNQDWAHFDNALALERLVDVSEERAIAQIYDNLAVSERLSSLASCPTADQLVTTDRSLGLEESVQNHESEVLRAFRSGYLLLRHWARCTAILDERFDLLTDEILLHLFIDTLDSLVGAEQNFAFDAVSILQVVMGCGKFLHPRKMLCAFGGRFAVLPPSKYAIEPLSPEGSRAFTTAVKAIKSGQTPAQEWSKAAREAFVNDHERFLKLESRCWVPKMRANFTKDLPGILVKLQAHFRNSERRVLVRIWPYSVVNLEDRQEGEDVYILGVYRFNEQREADADYLDQVCQQYMQKLRYDHTSASLDFGVTSRQEVVQLLPNGNDDQEMMLSRPVIDAASVPQSLQVESAKFRTASAVMDRLRWDPKHASLDYEVGYVDRFEKDLMWKNLDKWERMTEEEEFIPEHRIRKIRRKPEGTVVWDRQKRFDGTGAS